MGSDKQIESFKIDSLDIELEEDDLDLYYRLKQEEQVMVMKIRQAFQSLLINNQSLSNILRT